ncbi:MAG: hypothetical protein ACPGTU_02000 [Myxococcota bacterium]
MIRILTMFALWAIASWHRLRALDEAVIGSDSLGPYLQAWAAHTGHLPRPPNPESGDALWVTAWPLVALSSDLSSLFQLRFIVGGLIAPIGFLAAWTWASKETSSTRRWAGALATGIFLAFDSGLLDTLVSGARSYGAPELIGISVLCLAYGLRGNRWGVPAAACSFVLAAGHHPLAAGACLGLLPLLPTLRHRVGDRTLKIAAIVGAVCIIPRVLRVGSIAMCGEGPVQCLQQVAQSNVSDTTPLLATLKVALHDRWLVDLGDSGIMLLFGLLAIAMCKSSHHRLIAWATVAAYCGVLCFGAATGYIRSYHLRILAVPIAVAAGMGLARLWPLAVAAAVVFTIQLQGELPVGPDSGATQRADQIATMLPEGPIWVDRLWWNGEPKTDASAVVLSSLLAGRSNHSLDNNTQFALLTSGEGPMRTAHMSGDGWSVLLFSSSIEARSWLDMQSQTPHQIGGAYDWATILDPDTTLEDAHW